MTVWQEAKNWFLSSLKRYQGLELPDAGRSSVEDVPTLGNRVGQALSQFGGLQPEISFECLALLKHLMVYNPLMSQFVLNITNLGNTGHQVVIESGNSSQAETALKRINETASRLWPHGAGVDGLINQYFTDIAWSGALSSEDEVNFGARRVEKVVLVPVEQIRFDWDGQNYLPFQLPKHSLALNRGSVGMIPLNTETYRYYALSTVGNSPYAKPPATAAIEDLSGPYADGKANLKAILKKYGLLGFAAMQVTAPPRKPNELDDEYSKRAKSYLGKMRDAVSGIWQQGLLLMFRDQKIDFHSVAMNATGVKDIFEMIEAQVFNGFGMQPSLFGRVHSTTETFADVVWSQLDAQVTNIRRLPKRRMERTYQLDLLLAGVPFNSIAVRFNKTPSRNSLKDAQAEQTRVRLAIDKAKAGIISPDQAAQELGYDSAFDPELLSTQPEVAASFASLRAGAEFSATFQFDRSAGRYRFQPPTIELSPSGVGASVGLAKKKEQLTEEEIDAVLNEWIGRYLAVVEPIAETTLKIALETIGSWLAGIRLSDFNSAEEFAAQFFEQLQTVFTGEWESGRASREIKKATEQIYRYYRTKDDAVVFGGESPGIRVKFGAPDTRTLKFFLETDRWYFSKYLNNSEPSLKKFIAEEYVAKGGRRTFDMTPEQIADIRDALGERLKNVNDIGVQRIVNGSVTRARNWAHIRRLNEGAVKLAKIVAVLDERTSEICKFLDGKFLRVGVANDAVDRLSELEPGEFAKEMYESPIAKALATANQNADEVQKVFDGLIDDNDVLDDSLMAAGRGFPPYHLQCRTRVEGVIET